MVYYVEMRDETFSDNMHFFNHGKNFMFLLATAGNYGNLVLLSYLLLIKALGWKRVPRLVLN